MTSQNRLRLILLPGMTGTEGLLSELSAALSRNRPVSTISYPSDGPQDYATLTRFVQDRLPGGPFILLGESFSGPIALQIAARSGARVAGLIMAATFARHPLPTALTMFASWIDISMVPQLAIEIIMLGPYGTADLKSQFYKAIACLPAETLRTRMVETLTVDWSELLADVSCPALCLTGRHDRLIPSERGDEIVAGIAGCRRHTVEGPHMFLETHAYDSAAAIEQFCREADAMAALTTS